MFLDYDTAAMKLVGGSRLVAFPARFTGATTGKYRWAAVFNCTERVFDAYMVEPLKKIHSSAWSPDTEEGGRFDKLCGQ